MCMLKIFGATNCERRKRETMLWGGGGGGGMQPLLHKHFEDHCGSDFCFLSSYVYCTCSEYLNMGRE